MTQYSVKRYPITKPSEEDRPIVANEGDGKVIVGWFRFNAVLVAAYAEGRKRFGLLDKSAQIVRLSVIREKHARRTHIAALEELAEHTEIIVMRVGVTVRHYQLKPTVIEYTKEELLLMQQRHAQQTLPQKIAKAVLSAVALQSEFQCPLTFKPSPRRKLAKDKGAKLTLVPK